MFASLSEQLLFAEVEVGGMVEFEKGGECWKRVGWSEKAG